MAATKSVKLLTAACLAEFLAMLLFVVFACGTAMGIDGNRGQQGDSETGMTSKLPSWIIMLSLAFGLTITVLVYSTAHISGGHVNCAVTWGLVLTGNCPIIEGIAYFFSQMLGSLCGAFILLALYPTSMDMTKGVGSNGLAEGWHSGNALLGEIMGTFLLMMAVLQTACNPDSESIRAQAPVAIGFAVFMAHAVLLPIDGCSINPTRSFGPAVAAKIRYGGESEAFKSMWIFWVGPIIGASLAALVYKVFRALADTPATGKGQLEENEVADQATV